MEYKRNIGFCLIEDLQVGGNRVFTVIVEGNLFDFNDASALVSSKIIDVYIYQ